MAKVEICSDGVVLLAGRQSGGGSEGSGSGGSGSGEPQEIQKTITARLFIDCMGSGSPAVRQARGPGAIPDGVCMVAGTCARGPWPEQGRGGRGGRSGESSSSSSSTSSSSSPLPPPSFAADVIAAVDGAALGEGVIRPRPVLLGVVPGRRERERRSKSTSGEGNGDGADEKLKVSSSSNPRFSTKTTYMFQYSDLARPDLRPSLVEFVEEYWRRVRGYQGLKPERDGEGEDEGGEEGAGGGGGGSGPGGLFVESRPFFVERVLFGVFYTFRDSPLRPPRSWDSYLPAGDAAGLQSPLSFGGLGSLTRHVARIKSAVAEALACEALSASDLALINSCYSPNLSGAWMLQRAMAARPEQPPPYPDFVPDLLSAQFRRDGEAGRRNSEALFEGRREV